MSVKIDKLSIRGVDADLYQHVRVEAAKRTKPEARVTAGDIINEMLRERYERKGGKK
jgi:hypothetical protein